MKDIIKKTLIWLAAIVVFLGILMFIADVFIMPAYVASPEVKVPEVVGLAQDKAVEILKENKLMPIIQGIRYDNKIPKDHIIFQKPEGGSTVKENRRIFLHVSGGNPTSKMPDFINRTVRDAKIAIERMGFVLSDVEEVESELPANTIIEQIPNPGTNLTRGSKIKLKVSIGPSKGKVRVPDLVGMSYKEAVSTLQMNSLAVGTINYEKTNNLLPNTVISQFPSKNTLINVGETVDLFITKNQN